MRGRQGGRRGERLRSLGAVGEGRGRGADCGGEILEEGEEEEAWDGAEDCVEDEVV